MTKFQISSIRQAQDRNFKFQIAKGFTLIELAVVMGIFSTLVGISSINLLNTQKKTSLNATVQIFMADLKGQQLRAMVGDTAGEVDGSGNPVTDAFSVHFDDSSYTLFRSATYSVSDARNFKVNLPESVRFTPPNSEISFAKGSGEIPAQTIIVLRDVNDGSQKQVTLNRYGVIAAVD